MIEGIRKRINGESNKKLVYHFDTLTDDGKTIVVKGWIYVNHRPVDKMAVIMRGNTFYRSVDIPLQCRKDVNESQGLPIESKCAFAFYIAYSFPESAQVELHYEINHVRGVIPLFQTKKTGERKFAWIDYVTIDSDSNDDVKYSVDTARIIGNHLILKAWIFSDRDCLRDVRLVMSSGKKEKALQLEMTPRIDVANLYGLDDVNCGITKEIEFYTNEFARMYISYVCDGEEKRIYVGCAWQNSLNEGMEMLVCKQFTYKQFSDEMLVTENEKLMPNESVDLIIPVYNGYEFLEDLLYSIEKTSVAHRIFIVEDCSSDSRVRPYLREYVSQNENALLLENETNLGFVQSVNRALQKTSNHVVLINTDVVLPEEWLERLMQPIWKEENVATATPYTNSGTICSFPNIGENNTIFMDKSVDEVDAYFKQIRPRYVRMPTGVGFCMAMNRDVINKIGYLDADTFYKGYGEENDWCQRAICAGYHNVQVENLFVWHKHGGSFLSEDKKRYIECNSKIIETRYPNYATDVDTFFVLDRNKSIRDYIQIRMIQDETKEYVVVLDHDWGGGANEYMNKRIRMMVNDGQTVLRIVEHQEEGIIVWFYYDRYEASFRVDGFEEIYEIVCEKKVESIIVNEMVAFSKIKSAMDFVVFLKERSKASVSVLCHEFYPVCPSIYLMNAEKKHCFLPNIDECQKCYVKNHNRMNWEYDSISQWREIWSEFLGNCDEIITFSENTKMYYEKCYEGLKYVVRPHVVDYVMPLGEYEKTTDQITIGYIGNLMKAKGSEIIYRMADLIQEKRLNVRIVVIGPQVEQEERQDLLIHGKYKREELPDLIKEYGVDIVFIASIIPETFSYTTEEAIKMGLKVASFDLGAPAERLKKYDKGIIIPEISAEAALETILEEV